MRHQFQPKKKICEGQVVEAVLQIMEQHPQPMRNMKPSKKNPNAADQFQADHQAEYENNEAEVGNKDRAKQVDGHNAACPKMRDELEKRRSTTKASPPVAVAKGSRANRTINEMYFDPNCRACQKMRKTAKAKKRNTRTKSRAHYSKKRSSEKKSRVPKPRKAYRRAKSLSELIYFSKPEINTAEDQYSQTTMSYPSTSHHGSKSDVVSRYPDTSVNSISSYNSNMSLDHEPMVP